MKAHHHEENLCEKLSKDGYDYALVGQATVEEVKLVYPALIEIG